MGGFVGSGGGGDKDGLRGQALELVETQRPVVQRRGQPEAVLHQVLLARAVALVHAPQLGDGDMGFVDHQQGVLGQVIEQGRRRLAGLASGEIAGVVLDPGAVPQLLHHLDIELGALFQPLGLHQFVVVAQLLQPLAQFVLDQFHGVEDGLARGDIVTLGVDGQAWHPLQHLAGERVEVGQVLDLIIEQLHPHRLTVRLGRVDVDHLAAHPVGGALQLHVIAGVLQFRQPAQDEALIDAFAPHQVQHHAQVGTRVPQAVDGRHRGHQHRVTPFQQGLGGRQAHLLDVLVDGGIFLNKGIRGGHIGLGLVVVIIGNEVFHRIVREEFTHLAVELGRQGLVGGQDQGRPLYGLDDIGHGEGLAGAGHPQQGLMGKTILQAFQQFTDGDGLIPGRLHPGV